MTELPEGFIREKIKLPDGSAWYVCVIDKYSEDKVARTYVGELIYRWKYDGAPPGSSVVQDLRTVVIHSTRQLNSFHAAKSGFPTVTQVVAVPDNPAKNRSLPRLMANVVSGVLGVPDASADVVKIQVTQAAKLQSIFDPNSYKVHVRLDGETVLVVDDVFGSGNTIKSVAVQLRQAGASAVIGFCLAKTTTGMKKVSP